MNLNRNNENETQPPEVSPEVIESLQLRELSSQRRESNQARFDLNSNGDEDRVCLAPPEVHHSVQLQVSADPAFTLSDREAAAMACLTAGNQDQDEEEEEIPAVSSSATTSKCNNILCLKKNNIVVSKMMATSSPRSDPDLLLLSSSKYPHMASNEGKNNDLSLIFDETVAAEQSMMFQSQYQCHGFIPKHLLRSDPHARTTINALQSSSEQPRGQLQASTAVDQRAQQQSGGQPRGVQQESMVATMRHEAQLAAAQFLTRPGAAFSSYTAGAAAVKHRETQRDESLREEEVNETFENESGASHHPLTMTKQIIGNKPLGATATGLHTRMTDRFDQKHLFSQTGVTRYDQKVSSSESTPAASLTLDEANLDSHVQQLNALKPAMMNAVGPNQLAVASKMDLKRRNEGVRNKLPSISEQNESSKPTSKIDNSSSHQFLSSMITMRSFRAGQPNNMTASKKQLSGSVPSKKPIKSRAKKQEVQDVRDAQEERIGAESQMKVEALATPCKQYPTRVMINLDNPNPKHLPPIQTSTVETMQSQSQLTVQQKNFTFNETPSSAQQPQIATGLKNIKPKHCYQCPQLTARSSPLSSMHDKVQKRNPPYVASNQNTTPLLEKQLPSGAPMSAHTNLSHVREQGLLSKPRGGVFMQTQQVSPLEHQSHFEPLMQEAIRSPPLDQYQQIVLIPPYVVLEDSPVQYGQTARQQQVESQRFEKTKSEPGSRTPKPASLPVKVPLQQVQSRTCGTRTPVPLKSLLSQAKNQVKASVGKKKVSKKHAKQAGCRTPQLEAPHAAEYFSLMNTKQRVVQRQPQWPAASNQDQQTYPDLSNPAANQRLFEWNEYQKERDSSCPSNRFMATVPLSRQVQTQQPQSQMLQTPLFGNRALAAPFTATTTSHQSRPLASQSPSSTRPTVAQYYQDSTGAVFIIPSPNTNEVQLLQPRDTGDRPQAQCSVKGSKQTQAASQRKKHAASPPRGTQTHVGLNLNQFQNYMMLQEQSRVIGQIRRDIQYRKIQQDERAKIISRILADQENQQSLLAGDESSASMISRRHRRSLSASLEQSQQSQYNLFNGSYPHQLTSLPPFEKASKYVKQNQHQIFKHSGSRNNIKNHKRSNSSFVSSFAYSFVLEKDDDYVDKGAIFRAQPEAFANDLHSRDTRRSLDRQSICLNANFKMISIAPSGEHNLIGDNPYKNNSTSSGAFAENQPNSMPQRSRTTLRQGNTQGDMITLSSQFVKHHGPVSSESINALQSYYGGANTNAALQVGSTAGSLAINAHHYALTSDELMHSSRTVVANQTLNAFGQSAMVTSLNGKILLAKRQGASGNAEDTSSQPTTAKYHASSQSQAVLQSFNDQSRKLVEEQKNSNQFGQTNSSHLTTMRGEQSISQINASQVLAANQANNHGNKNYTRSFGDTVQGSGSRARLMADQTKTTCNFNGPSGARTPYLFHQSPIELRSQAADSIHNVFQLHEEDKASQPAVRCVQRHLSESRRELASGEFEYGQDQGAIFERESVQNEERVKGTEADKGEKTVLLETAGFLPLKTVMQQFEVVHKMDAAQSSEGHSSPGAKYHKEVFAVPNHDQFYALQSQGTLPSKEPKGRGVLTTTSFLEEVSICKTPTDERRSRNVPNFLEQQQLRSQPLAASSLSSQLYQVLKFSQTCRLEANNNEKSTKDAKQAFTTSQRLTNQNQSKSMLDPRFQNNCNASSVAVSTRARTQRQVLTRCVLPSKATKTNLRDLPSVKTSKVGSTNGFSSARQHISSSISHEMIQPKMSSFQSSLERQKNSLKSVIQQQSLAQTATANAAKKLEHHSIEKGGRAQTQGKQIGEGGMKKQLASTQDGQEKNCQIF